MKLFPILFFAAMCASHAANPLVIINTRFDQVADGKFVTSTPPDTLAEVPLTSPSRFQASPPSTMEPGTEPVGEIRPPFALIHVRERAENSEAPANVFVQWNLKNLPLEPGRYQFQFRVGVSDFLTDAGNFCVGLIDAKGKDVNSVLSNIPRISFSDGKIRTAPRGGVPYSNGGTYLLEILVDTQKATWGTSINGEVLQEEVPFNAEFLDQLGGEIRIGSFIYVCTGGMDNCRPGGVLALTDVKMSKVE